MGQIYEEPRNQGAVGWMKAHTIIPKDPPGDSVLPISTHRGDTFTEGHSNSPYKLDTMAATWALQIPCVQGRAGKRRVIIMTGVTDQTSGIGGVAITQQRLRGICMVIPGDSLKCLLVFPCPFVMTNGQVQQLLLQRAWWLGYHILQGCRCNQAIS